MLSLLPRVAKKLNHASILKLGASSPVCSHFAGLSRVTAVAESPFHMALDPAKFKQLCEK